MWNLPLLAQYLAPDDEQRRKLEQAGKAHYIFNLDKNLLKTLIAQHIPGYMKWCVEGAVMYYANNQNIDVPQTVAKASPKEDMDLLEMFKSFIQSNFKKSCHRYPLSISEIREVFLMYEGLDIELDNTTQKHLNKIMQERFVDEKTRMRGFEHVKKFRHRFPTRTVRELITGYSGIQYKSGLLGGVVNILRSQNQDDHRPKISEAPSDVEDNEDEMMDPA